MTLKGSVLRAPPMSIGFDINKKINRVTARQYYQQGFRFCLRYISRATDTEAPGDLSEDEAEYILDAGLALMVVQHFAGDGWQPTADLGKTYGHNAASNAAQAGIPEGVNVFLDLEGIKKGTAASDVIAYCNAWFAAVDNAGYTSGVYVGANAILSSDELFWDLKTKHYWKSGSDVPDISHRGYQMVQTIRKGQIDRNVTKDDAQGEGVYWLISDTAASALS